MVRTGSIILCFVCLVAWPGWGQTTPSFSPGDWLHTQAAARHKWHARAYDTGLNAVDARPERAQALALWSIGCHTATGWNVCNRLHAAPQSVPSSLLKMPTRPVALFCASALLTMVWLACTMLSGRTAHRRRVRPPSPER